MKFLAIVIMLCSLAACATPQHPLTYVHKGDPVWSINPTQSVPPPREAQKVMQRASSQ